MLCYIWTYVTASKAVSFGSPNRTLHTLCIFGIKNVVTHTLPVSPPSPAGSSSLPTRSIPIYPTASGARAKCLSDNDRRMDTISKLPHYPYLSMCDTLNKQTNTLVHCHWSLQIYLFLHPVDRSVRLIQVNSNWRWILISHSGADEDSVLLGCYNV